MALRRISFRIASSCEEDWDAMAARSGGRHCGSCDRQVYELHALARRAAEALVRELHAADGRVCARIAVDADGGALFAPTPGAMRHVPPALALAAALVAGCAEAGGAEPKPAAVMAPLRSAPLGSDAGPRDAGPRDAGPAEAGHAPSTPCRAAIDGAVNSEQASEPTDRQLAAHSRRKRNAQHPPQVMMGMMMLDD